MLGPLLRPLIIVSAEASIRKRVLGFAVASAAVPLVKLAHETAATPKSERSQQRDLANEFPPAPANWLGSESGRFFLTQF